MNAMVRVTDNNRAVPPLPVRHANPHIQSTLNSGSIPPVKYQILNCQGTDILVGRLKIETPTPSGHAFILRRFDTGAVSLTTMFRAAFPNAADDDEKKEVQWVKENYDLTGNNGSSKEPHITRLAGTWVSPTVALEIGNYYALGALINAVVSAKPDPNGNYRRSGKNAAAAAANQSTVTAASSTSSTATSNAPQPASRTLPTPSPTHAGPGPAKRRKESSPAPTPAPARAASPSKRAASPSKLPTRRSTRTKSPMPVPRSAAMPTLATVMSKTPSPVKVTKSSPQKAKKKEEAATPASSDKTAVEDEGESLIDDGVAGEELHKQDIEEQKQLIENLKAQRDAARKVTTEEQIQDQGMIDTAGIVTEDGGKKRTREDEDKPLQFEFKEPEVGKRAIVRNNRAGRFQMEPRTKSVAWGVAAFAVAMGAV
ncbi:hypothetical protein BDQ17DRAFT_1368995 [Cyathus striatus]|nr:hypothetical protein BDQ17DRAFT_1368995 [Cyathus striatus]